MPSMLVVTPLKKSAVSRPYQFANGISIRQIPSFNWDASPANGLLSERERKELSTTQYWLCAEKECEHGSSSPEKEIFDAAYYAAMALQITCPTGAMHVFLRFRQSPEGWVNLGSQHPKPLHSTRLGRNMHLEDQGLGCFDSLYEGIKRAFEDKLVRLQNPIMLLEHGQQIGNPYLSTLMSVMALDMLFMAGQTSPFVNRLGGFLGPATLIFPPDVLYQSTTTVREVLKDLYELRNIIAHGQEVPKQPYREKYDLTSTGGQRIHDDFYYGELMHEAGLFILTTALRKIFTEQLYDDVADPSRWRRKLKAYEAAWKSAGGIRTVPRGRRNRA